MFPVCTGNIGLELDPSREFRTRFADPVLVAFRPNSTGKARRVEIEDFDASKPYGVFWRGFASQNPTLKLFRENSFGENYFL